MPSALTFTFGGLIPLFRLVCSALCNCASFAAFKYAGSLEQALQSLLPRPSSLGPPQLAHTFLGIESKERSDAGVFPAEQYLSACLTHATTPVCHVHIVQIPIPLTFYRLVNLNAYLVGI